MNDHSITLEFPRFKVRAPAAVQELPLPARLDGIVERNRTHQVVGGLFAIGITIFALAISLGLAS